MELKLEVSIDIKNNYYKNKNIQYKIREDKRRREINIPYIKYPSLENYLSRLSNK